MTGVVCVLVAALALAAGIVVGRRWGRSRGVVPPTAAPPAPALGDLLQRVFSATDEGLVVVDRSGAAVLANGRAARAGRGRRRRQPDARAVAACAEVRERRHDDRRRPVAARPARPSPGRRARQGAPAGRRLHDGRGHGHVRRRAAGGHPPRFRGQREPRAQDARGRGRAARRGRARRRRRPRRGPPVRHQDRQRGEPARQPRHRADRAVPAHRRRRAPGAVARRHRRGRGRGVGPHPALGGGRADRDRRRQADRARGRRRPDPADHRAVQPHRERDRLLARRDTRLGVAAGRRATASRSP